MYTINVQCVHVDTLKEKSCISILCTLYTVHVLACDGMHTFSKGFIYCCYFCVCLSDLELHFFTLLDFVFLNLACTLGLPWPGKGGGTAGAF